MKDRGKLFVSLMAVFVAAIVLVLATTIVQGQGSPAPTQTDPVSCMDILVRGGSTGDGVYTIDPDGPGGSAPVDVYCDMTTDGGGWTLVASTRDTTLNDQGGVYYTDVMTLTPTAGHESIWAGMAPVAWSDLTDVRFSCRSEVYDGPFDVDLAFYDVPWYGEFASSTTDAGVCFEESNGDGQTLPPPARRNLLTGDFRPLGDQWDAGFLEGEVYCSDTGGFTVDFDDRGMDGNQSDGTDWGEDDESRKCGVSGIPGGSWFIWMREPRGISLTPEVRSGLAEPGSSAVYTLTLSNFTEITDTFTLALSGNQWPATLSTTTIGPLPHMGSADISIQVDVPPGIVAGDSDAVTVIATSVTSPALLSDQSELNTYALSGQYGYVFNASDNEIDLVDTVLHLDTGMSIDTSLYGSWPHRGALSPDGSLLYVSLRGSGRVLVVDTLTHTPVTSVTVGSYPQGIAFSPDGAHAFVANASSNSVSVIDTGSSIVTATIPVGSSPQAIGVSPCLDKLYVVSRWGNALSVIDLDTLTVIHTITGLDNELGDVVISPYGHRAYVTGQGEGVIHVIDTFNDSLIDTWHIDGSYPERIDVLADGSTVYVASVESGVLFAVDTGTGDLEGMLSTAPVNESYGPSGVETFPSAAGPYAYVTVPGLGEVLVLDSGTNVVTSTFLLGGGPRGMALFPPETVCRSDTVLVEPPVTYEYGQAGDTLVFTGTVVNLTGANDSFVLALSNDVWTATLSTPNIGPLTYMEGVDFTVEMIIPAGAEQGNYDQFTLTATSVNHPDLYSDTAQLTAAVPQPGYAFAKTDEVIHVLDTQFHQDTGITIDAGLYGGAPWEGTLSPDGESLYVALQNDPVVLVISTTTHSPVTTLPVGNNPHDIVFVADGAYALVANHDSDTVSVIDTAALTVTATLNVGDGPASIATVPCLNRVYVGNLGDSTISVIDSALMTVTGVITGFDTPRDLVASPFGDRIFVASFYDSRIDVIDTGSDTIVDTWSLKEWRGVSALDISSFGRWLYVADSENGYLYVMDVMDGTPIAAIFVGMGRDPELAMEVRGGQAWEVEVFPIGAGPYAYVTVPRVGNVRVIDTVRNTVVGSLPTGAGLRGLALFPEETMCAAQLHLPTVLRSHP